MKVECTDVLVVGGGLVGLAAAAFLARQGVRTTLVEQRTDTSRHPKARLVTVRSMELYRALDIEDAVRAAGEPNGGFALADTLRDDHETWIPAPAEEAGAGDLSPCTPWSCDQQRIEPILRRRAEELRADIRFGTRADVLDPPGDDTSDEVLLTTTGGRRLAARFVVAADGIHSPLRTSLGITMDGEPVSGTAISVLFRADLGAALLGRHVDALLCRAAGAFLFSRGGPADRTWQLGTYVRPDWNVDDTANLHRALTQLIRTATGLPGLMPEIIDARTWETGAYVARRYRHGPVFLAGDAAHVMPPYGGFGGNTGVADAHNLAWKLGRVCRGEAPVSLLDTYEAERRPLGALTVAQALLRSRKIPGAAPPPDQIDATALQLGFRYPNGDVEDPTRPSGAPGTRAPHVALDDGRSLLDLIDPTHGATVTDDLGGRIAPAHRYRWDSVYSGRITTVRPDGIISRSEPVSTEPRR